MFKKIILLTFLFVACERDKIILDIEAPAEDLTFQKITKTFASGGKFTVANILANVQGKKTGYKLKIITDLNPNNLVTVSDKKELNFSGGFGNFTATITLEHRAKKDATITNCEFEITRGTAENLSFQKVSKDFVSGGKFTTTDILDGVQGNKTGYTIKEINTLNPNDFATVSPSPTKELNFKNKAGNFTATIILQHPTKKDATIKKCEFEITNAIIPTWEKTFGSGDDNGANSIVETTDGGFVLAGHTLSYSKNEINFLVIKLDNTGKKIWEKTFGHLYNSKALSIFQTKDDGLIVGGYGNERRSGDQDFLIIKLDKNGNKVWQKTFGENSEDEVCHSIIQTKDGGFALVGKTRKSARKDNTWVIKLDASGNQTWDRKLASSQTKRAITIIQVNDGGYIIAGYQDIKNRDSDGWVVKLDRLGDIVWEKTFGGSYSDYFNDIIQTNDGNLMATGATNSSVWVVKLNSSTGNKILEKNFRNKSIANSIIQTKDGGFAIGASTYRGNPRHNFWAIRLDNSRNIIWEKTFGKKSSWNICYSMIETKDGGFVMIGNAGPYGNWNVRVIKIDKDGNL